MLWQIPITAKSIISDEYINAFPSIQVKISEFNINPPYRIRTLLRDDKEPRKGGKKRKGTTATVTPFLNLKLKTTYKTIIDEKGFIYYSLFYLLRLLNIQKPISVYTNDSGKTNGSNHNGWQIRVQWIEGNFVN